MLRAVDRWRGCFCAREGANHLVVTSEEVSIRQFLVPMYNCFYMFIMVSVPKVFIVYFLIWFSICHSKKQLWNSHVLHVVYQILIECPLWDDYFSKKWRHRNGYDKEIAFIEVADKKWVNINSPINVEDWGHSSAGWGLGDTAQVVEDWGTQLSW